MARDGSPGRRAPSAAWQVVEATGTGRKQRLGVLHADIERLIAAVGLESTIIGPGMFASNALFWWATAIRADGVSGGLTPLGDDAAISYDCEVEVEVQCRARAWSERGVDHVRLNPAGAS